MPASRRRSTPIIVGLLAAITVVAVIGYLRTQPSGLDRFYEPPGGVSASDRGEILRTEPADAGDTAAVSYRLLYRTETVDGRAVAASGFVAWPTAEPPPGGFPIVAYGHPTLGLADDCAASRRSLPSIDRGELVDFLEAGFAVAAADFPGLGPPDDPHPYLVGPPTAASVIDVVRAARARAGDRLSNQVVGWGYSQGGHAVLWARAAAGDAPELDWRGTVALAPVVDLAYTAQSAELGGALGVAIAMGQATKGLDLAPVLTDAGQATREDLAEDCALNAIRNAIDNPRPLLTDDRAWTDDLSQDAPPTAGVGPALVVYGSDDGVVGTDAVGRWVQGADDDAVTGRELAGEGHGGLVEAFGPPSIDWMRDRVSPPS